jgi:hypothetical protein
MLPKNINRSGRILRAAAGVALLAYAAYAKSWIALGFAAFCFFEAFMSWCVVYQILGKSSCPYDKK